MSSRDKILDATFEEVYIYGYAAASTTRILKKAKLPRGSLYHYFPSKKALVLAMIEERLAPKVREFFDFEIREGEDALAIIEHTVKKMSKNEMLLKYGCPLHRLMFEMASQDIDIAMACEDEFKRLANKLEKVLKYGIERGEIREEEPKEWAEFFILSTWGILSRMPHTSDKTLFLKDMHRLIWAIAK